MVLLLFQLLILIMDQQKNKRRKKMKKLILKNKIDQSFQLKLPKLDLRKIQAGQYITKLNNNIAHSLQKINNKVIQNNMMSEKKLDKNNISKIFINNASFVTYRREKLIKKEPKAQIIINVNSKFIKLKFSYEQKTTNDLKNFIIAEIKKLEEFKNKQVQFITFPFNFKIDFMINNIYSSLQFLKNNVLTVKPIVKSKENKKVCISNFKIVKCIGEGGFSKVFLVKSLMDGKYYAMKIMDKKFIISSKVKFVVQNQKTIMSQFSHPFILKLYYSFQTIDFFVLIVEYCPAGDLSMQLKKHDYFNQKIARFYFVEIILAIQALHQKNIIYRDIKPENILLGIDGHIRLCDFGLAKTIFQNKMTTYSFCGSPEYMPPEMIMKSGHSYPVDFYCLGILLYQMVTGKPPFMFQNKQDIYEATLFKKIEYPQNISLSKELKKLINSLLCKNSKLRLGSYMGVKELLIHPWIGKVCRNEFIRKKITPPFVFNSFDKIKWKWQEYKQYELEYRKMMEGQSKAVQKEEIDNFYFQNSIDFNEQQNFAWHSKRLKLDEQYNMTKLKTQS